MTEDTLDVQVANLDNGALAVLLASVNTALRNDGVHYRRLSVRGRCQHSGNTEGDKYSSDGGTGARQSRSHVNDPSYITA